MPRYAQDNVLTALKEAPIPTAFLLLYTFTCLYFSACAKAENNPVTESALLKVGLFPAVCVLCIYFWEKLVKWGQEYDPNVDNAQAALRR